MDTRGTTITAVEVTTTEGTVTTEEGPTNTTTDEEITEIIQTMTNDMRIGEMITKIFPRVAAILIIAKKMRG